MKPQEEAKADYDKAVENKTMAFLGEETKADIFKVPSTRYSEYYLLFTIYDGTPSKMLML